MTRLVVFAPEIAIASSVGLAKDLLWLAVTAAATSDRVVVATSDGGPARCGGGTVIAADYALADLDTAALVWVAGFWDDPDTALTKNAACVPWLARLAQRGTLIAGHGPATTLLAEAGLLDHRIATVYSGQTQQFHRRYPDVDLRPRRALTAAANIYCAVGISSGCDLLIALIDCLYGSPVAATVQSQALVDLDRGYRIATLAFDGQKYHGDDLALTAQEYFESHYPEPISITALARRLGVDPRTLTRRFTTATGDTPSAYLQRVRIEAAKDILRRSTEPLTTIAMHTGYTDVRAFTRAFHRHTGTQPAHYRRDINTPPDRLSPHRVSR